MKSILRLVAVLGLTVLACPAPAEERNGLLVNVTRRTIDRGERRDPTSYSGVERTQGVKLVARNTSLRSFPEGEVHWTMLVRRASSGSLSRYSGKDKLKALRSSETAELMIGSVPVSITRSDRNYKDEIEYDISVVHAGKETIRLTSTSNFTLLAKRATPADDDEDDDRRHRRDGAADPAQPGVAPDGTKPPMPPGLADGTKPMIPGAPTVPGSPASLPGTPANPAAPVPSAPGPAPAPMPDQPKPVEQPAPPPGDSQPFDFFNLKNKKPAAPQ